MILTSKQEEGLKIAVERHRNGERYTTIAGYAGEGPLNPTDEGLKTHLGKTCEINFCFFE